MYNVLVCDDEKDIVSALKIYLGTQNYQVYEAYNGQEAIDIVNQEDIHCILLDIMMPKVDGIEAMKIIRQDRNIPVILITAKSEDTDIVLGLLLLNLRLMMKGLWFNVYMWDPMTMNLKQFLK